MGDSTSTCSMTDKQRQRVRDNVGLVGVHLKRFVPNLSQPRRDREWDDLFQEGCLGLIRAAVDYDPQRGIPFAAFAFPRIHNAVSRALQRKFSTIYVPPPRTKPRPASGQAPSESHRSITRKSITTQELFEPMIDGLYDRKCHHHDASNAETVGQRLRAKYERAVQVAARLLSAKTSTRGDRDKLVSQLVEDRLLVPDDEAKTALRQIARDTGSSYARVAQCDKQLHRIIREALEGDPEFKALHQLSKTHPDGTYHTIEPALERNLARMSADAFVQSMRQADSAGRVQLLDTLLGVSQVGLDDAVYKRVVKMPNHMRERLFHTITQKRARSGSKCK